MNIICPDKNLKHLVDIDRLNSQSIVFDIGACKGDYIKALRTYIKCEIIALEPNKTNFQELKCLDYDNLKIFNCALTGKYIKKVKFTEYIGKDGKFYQWSNIGDVYKSFIVKRKEYLSTVNYDIPAIFINFIFNSFNSYQRIDYLKMDIEGEEDNVIKYMDPSVAARIYQISYELHNKNKKQEHLKMLSYFGYNTTVKDDEIYATRF